MKRSTKIFTVIIVFFLIIASVIIARTMIGNHFKKKFSKRPPPGIIVTQVIEKKFEDIIETFGTAIPSQIKSYKIEKYEILTPINFNSKVNKGEIIANLKTRKIIAPFDGIIGKRDFSDDILVSKSSILLNLEDTTIIFSDVEIPEVYAPFIRNGLPVDVIFSGYKNKIYSGMVDSTSSRINSKTRSLSTRIKINNEKFELLPGALLEITIKYNERNTLSVPDTSIVTEGSRSYVFIVDENNKAIKTEVKTGKRYLGNLEILGGLSLDDKIVAEGLKKVRPNSKIKPIIN
ncbi:MAG: efflux RND transporter periplasmic adaptor subunit [Candidatus Pelagibacter sp.]